MVLKGHGSELSLADIVQTSALARRTCRLKVRGIEQAGELYLEQGQPAHACYGVLRGEAAFFAMVSDDYVIYHMESGIKPPERTIHSSAEHLLMEAMRHKDECALDDEEVHQSDSQEGSSQMPPVPSPSHRMRLFLVAVAAVVMGSLGFGGWLATSRLAGAEGDAPDTARVKATARQAHDASSLIGPGDLRPQLISGAPPAMPIADSTLKPTIVCRLLVDTHGRVLASEVYLSRPHLEAYELAALEAVASYRFSPAKRNGVAVPAWINFPVKFR